MEESTLLPLPWRMIRGTARICIVGSQRCFPTVHQELGLRTWCIACYESVSLASGFLVAGAQRVLSTLWRLSDAGSALLLGELYRRLLESRGQESLTQALSNAQTWLRQLRYWQAREHLSLGPTRGSLSHRALLRSLRCRGAVRAAAGEADHTVRLWLAPEPEATEEEEETSGTGTQAAELMAQALHEACFTPSPPTLALLGLSESVSRAPSSPALYPGTGERFTAEHWAELVAAFEVSGGGDDPSHWRLLYSHLFPVAREDKTGWMPERDLWLEYKVPGVGTRRAILHLHFPGPWQELDESRLAQVNARFPNTAGYQYEAHGEVASGIMPTAKMFRITAAKTSPSQGKDPTKWMGGGPGQPPAWLWRSGGELQGLRETDPAPEVTVHGQHMRLYDYYEKEGVLQRFKDLYRLLSAAYAQLEASSASTLWLPLEDEAGGRRVAVGPEPDPEWRPFASPRYWAAFVVAGDGDACGSV